MIGATEVKPGMALRLENQLFYVTQYQHVKPGKGGAFIRLKLKNAGTGAVLDRTYRASEKFDQVRLERTKMQYLYSAGDEYHFMNEETYEQIALQKDFLGETTISLLKEEMNIDVLMSEEGKAITCEMPNFVELTVVQTDPGVKGDTASGGTKPATLETGAVVQVPLFLEEGTVIKVDTRSCSYVERVS